jgi:hypothetical protein
MRTDTRVALGTPQLDSRRLRDPHGGKPVVAGVHAVAIGLARQRHAELLLQDPVVLAFLDLGGHN